MDPLTISAIASAAPAVLQGIQSGIQGLRAGRIRNRRPTYNIPKEIYDNVATATGAYNAASMYGMPGQGRIQNNIAGSQASSNQAIMQSQQSPAAMLAGLSSVNQNTSNAMANLGADAARFRQSNMDNTRLGMLSAKQALAAYKDREFEINKMKPFQDAMFAQGALRGASQQNLYGAVSSLANTAGQYATRGGFKQPSQTMAVASTVPGTGVGTQGRDAVINTLINTPEYAGMTREQVESIVYGI